MYQSSAGERRGSPPSLEGRACGPYPVYAALRENPAFRGLRRLRLEPALPRPVTAQQLADPVIRTGARDGLGSRPNSAVQ